MLPGGVIWAVPPLAKSRHLESRIASKIGDKVYSYLF